MIEPLRLTIADAGEIVTLQRAAYVTEAQLHADLMMPALTQTVAELEAELADPACAALAVRENGRLVACLRMSRLDASTAEINGNQRLYRRLGYEITGQTPADDYHIVHMARQLR